MSISKLSTKSKKKKTNHRSKKYVLLIMILFILFPGLLAGNYPIQAEQEPAKMDAQVFHNDMHQLWDEQSTWEHLFVSGTLANLPYREASLRRLMQNQENIGNAIKPFYGEEAGDRLAALLTEHVVICDALLQAAKKANAQEFEATVARWYANADETGEFLNKLDPENWPVIETKITLRTYLDFTLEAAMARWNGDFVGNMSAHEKAHAQAIVIADMLSDGITKRFKDQFKSNK
jgi:hypothetical protein